MLTSLTHIILRKEGGQSRKNKIIWCQNVHWLLTILNENHLKSRDQKRGRCMVCALTRRSRGQRWDCLFFCNRLRSLFWTVVLRLAESWITTLFLRQTEEMYERVICCFVVTLRMKQQASQHYWYTLWFTRFHRRSCLHCLWPASDVRALHTNLTLDVGYFKKKKTRKAQVQSQTVLSAVQ